MMREVVEGIILNYEREIQLQELGKIRLPYAAIHTLQGSAITVCDSLIDMEHKKDDYLISEAVQDEDFEPIPSAMDYHIPYTNKLNFK
jgi:hypothetical protein